MTLLGLSPIFKCHKSRGLRKEKNHLERVKNNTIAGVFVTCEYKFREIMILELDYKSFCDIYYTAAEQVADITIAEHIKKHGPLSPYIDVDLVKDLGVSYGLEKVYNKYDVDHESNAIVKTFLSKVVRNCVLTELGKESTAVGAKIRPGKSMDSLILSKTIGGGHISLESFSEAFRTSGRFEKKEDLIARMLECLKKLNGVDQIILRCWMVYPRREYTDMALEELGWDNNARTRNMVSVRCNRAIEALGEKMDDARSVYREIMSEAQKKAEPVSKPTVSIVDYNFTRRRQRAAKKAITSQIDYAGLAKILTSSIPD